MNSLKWSYDRSQLKLPGFLPVKPGKARLCVALDDGSNCPDLFVHFIPGKEYSRPCSGNFPECPYHGQPGSRKGWMPALVYPTTFSYGWRPGDTANYPDLFRPEECLRLTVEFTRKVLDELSPLQRGDFFIIERRGPNNNGPLNVIPLGVTIAELPSRYWFDVRAVLQAKWFGSAEQEKNGEGAGIKNERV